MKKATVRIFGRGWETAIEDLLIRPGLTVQMLLDRVEAPDYCLFIPRRGKGRMLPPEAELYPLLYIRRKNELIVARVPQGRAFPLYWGDEPQVPSITFHLKIYIKSFVQN